MTANEAAWLEAEEAPPQRDSVWRRLWASRSGRWGAVLTAIILGLAVLAWSAFFVQREHGGLGLILLSVALLLFGGGIFPPVIGVIAGALGTRISKPLDPQRSRLSARPARALAALWPWSLALYVLWVFGQFAVGHFFNDWLLANGYIIIVTVLGTLSMSVVTCYANDLRRAALARSPAGG